MKGYLYILAVSLCFAGCSSVGYQYSDQDGKIHCDTDVPIGKTKAAFGFGIVTNLAYPLIENDYPTVSARYSSDSNEVYNLKQLDVKLIVDGKEIQPDSEVFTADYYNTYLVIDKNECCTGLGERLGIDRKSKDDLFRFSVGINKKYKSFKTFPPQVTVVLSATTDKGATETTKVLSLSSYEDNSFIRVH